MDIDTKDEAFVQGVAESHETAINDGFVTLPDGAVLAGVEAPTPPTLGTPQPQTAPTTQDINPETGRMFSAAEVEAARKQERDKLYADLEKERQRRKELEKAEKERMKIEEEALQAAEEERRKAELAEMDARQFAETRISEIEVRLAEERAQRESLEATLEQERNFIALEQYRNAKLQSPEVQEGVLPELRDLIGGNTPEDIDASIESLQARTASILGNVQQTVASVRQGMQGASVTAPPVGPMDTQQSYQQISPEDIRAMSPQEYAQHRDRLLGAVRQQVSQRGSIYG